MKGRFGRDIKYLIQKGIIKGKLRKISSLKRQEKMKERRELFESIYNTSPKKLTVRQDLKILTKKMEKKKTKMNIKDTLN